MGPQWPCELRKGPLATLTAARWDVKPRARKHDLLEPEQMGGERWTAATFWSGSQESTNVGVAVPGT